MAKAGPRAIQLAGWQQSILRNDKGAPRKIVANAIAILANDPRWEGVLAYDEFAETIVTVKPPPWRACDAPSKVEPGDWSDQDTTRVQAYLSDSHAVDLGDGPALAAVAVAAMRNRVHPVRDWLDGLRWDGRKRAPTWLVDVMGADDTPYTRAVGQAFLVACVARVYHPGCKVDTVPILEGDQGIGKSSTIRALVGDTWFLEMSIADIASKDAMQILRRKWIAEMPEIDGFSRSETSHFKGYVSRQVDTYRASYGKGARDYPRQTCFIGTTNATEYLKDETGGRRFWPVRCRRGSPAAARDLREQLWAEAVARYQSHEEWHVSDPELLEEFTTQQDSRYRGDPWEQKVAAWLEVETMPRVGERKAERGVTTADVLGGALGLEGGKWTLADSVRAGAVLRRLGWLPGAQERRDGARIRPYRPKAHANGVDTSGVVLHLEPEPIPPQEGEQDELAFEHLG